MISSSPVPLLSSLAWFISTLTSYFRFILVMAHTVNDRAANCSVAPGRPKTSKPSANCPLAFAGLIRQDPYKHTALLFFTNSPESHSQPCENYGVDEGSRSGLQTRIT